MYFQHSSEIWGDFPELVAGVLFAEGVDKPGQVQGAVTRFNAIAADRLATGPESELPEIQAWRRTFSKMGLKPTQYRCASEALLRRFKKEKSLPSINPVIDLCNSISLAFATPIAVFDVSKIADHLEVCYAAGDETYLTFSGETENPEPHEVVFADGEKRAHARRWTNRQSGYSAVREQTAEILIVTEAMHDTASVDVPRLVDALAEEFTATWSVTPKRGTLSQFSPRFDF